MKYIPPDLGKVSENSSGQANIVTKIKNTLLVIAFLILGYFLLGYLANILARHVPEHYEAKLSFFDTNPPKATEPLFKEFHLTHALFKKLVQAEQLRPLPYKLFVVSMETPNAFAFPGGTIGLTSGFLKEEIGEMAKAFVIAHELGHHQHRDTLKRLGRSLLHQIVFSTVFGNSPSSLPQAALQMAELSFSREQERQADHFGMTLLHQQFGQTKGALEFFEKIQEKELGPNNPWQALVTTHPYTAERIRALKKLINEMENHH